MNKISLVTKSQEKAIHKITDNFKNLSLSSLNHAWRATKIPKFQSLVSNESPTDITQEQILNEKLETRLVLEED